jgi:copper chaperone NosL
MKLVALLILSYGALICQPERAARISYDSSLCSYCKMLIQEKSFGAELETDSGVVYFFDATECLAAYLIDEKIPLQRVKRLWSVEYQRPFTLVEAKGALYIHSDKFLSPMSMNIAAFGSREQAGRVIKSIGGEILTWDDVLALVQSRWFPKHVPKSAR